MTDLEKAWDDLPTGEPPTEAILRAARVRAAARRRLVTRPLIATGAAAALVGAFVAGAKTGGVSTDLPGGSDASPAAFQADLDPARSCAELLASYRDRGADRVTAWGWQDPEPIGYATDLRMLENGAPVPLAGRISRQTASDTGTNVQEAGVDEPDTVKTDGERLVRLRGDDLVTYDVTGETPRKKSTLHLPRLDGGELLLVGNRVVVVGADRGTPRDDITGERRGSRVFTVSLKDDADPKITSDVTYASRVLSVRQRGGAVRMVLAAGLPDLDLVEPAKGRTSGEALEENRRIVRESTLSDWLPTFDAGGGEKRLVDCTNVAIPPDDLGLDTVTIVGFDAAKPEEPQTIGIAAATTIAYESSDHLYLASSLSTAGCWDCRFTRLVRPVPQSGTSHVFDFDLDGIRATHVASGEVEGTIADRWSMDEADDVLRVAVGPSSETGNANAIVTLRRDGTELVEEGRLDGLGRNEDLKGVRWFDDLAIAVTFRQVDPLFTIDLTNPAKPRLLGTLKIPGFSDYLHPLNDRELLGIGERDGSAQIALFDVSDLADVRQVAVERYPGSTALAGQEPRAFTWLSDQRTVLTVLQKGNTGYVDAVTVRPGKLTSRLTAVEHGSDIAGVRTIGLPGGRVALVTGEDVRFFDLP